jgi:two-component system, NarL family, sensor kinase
MPTKLRPGLLQRLADWLYSLIMSVPVHVKIAGLVLLPVIILGVLLNYWIASGLRDWLSYLLTDVRVDAAMRAGQRSVQLVTVLGAAGSLLVAYLLTFLLTRPLLSLRKTAQQVAAGDLTARTPVWSKDEIGQLAIAVNTMTDHLVTSQEELSRSNRHLTAINRVILAANRPAEIHEVLYSILGIVVDVMGLETGWIYLRDPERARFHLATWHGVPDTLQAELLHKPEEPLCRCQQEFIEGRLQPGANICACLRLNGFYPAKDAHHVTVPLAALDQQFGVMNLLTKPDQPVSDDDLELLRAIGAQISEIVASAWLSIKLEEKEKARQLLLEFLVKAQEEERGRLARELHDGAGQMLTSLLVRIKTLEKKADTTALRSGLLSLLDVTAETLEQVRELSYRLRPAALEEFGLSVALETLAHDMGDEAGMIIDYRTDLDGSMLTPEAEVTLYRIAQEALTNVVRHAQAEQISVDLVLAANSVMLRIEDNGRGFSPHQASSPTGQSHMGLISMQERTEIIGGSFELMSAPGHGTSVQVQIPLKGNIQ